MPAFDADAKEHRVLPARIIDVSSNEDKDEEAKPSPKLPRSPSSTPSKVGDEPALPLASEDGPGKKRDRSSDLPEAESVTPHKATAAAEEGNASQKKRKGDDDSDSSSSDSSSASSSSSSSLEEPPPKKGAKKGATKEATEGDTGEPAQKTRKADAAKATPRPAKKAPMAEVAPATVAPPKEVKAGRPIVVTPFRLPKPADKKGFFESPKVAPKQQPPASSPVSKDSTTQKKKAAEEQEEEKSTKNEKKAKKKQPKPE